jgi:hypothetical protein
LTDRINPPEAACGGEWLHERRSGEALKQDCTVMQQYPRLFARLRPEGRVSRVAKIFVDPKAPVIECILVDYSAGGACLQLQKFIQLPERFEVLYGTTRKRCRVVWKRAMRIGVAF